MHDWPKKTVQLPINYWLHSDEDRVMEAIRDR
jgi:hypothetical protein